MLIHLLAGLSTSIANFVFIRTGLHVLLELRTRLYAALQALSLKFHELRPTSDSSFRVAYDSQFIQTLYSKGFTAILGSVVTIVSMSVIMLTLGLAAHFALNGDCSIRDMGDSILRRTRPPRIEINSGTRKRQSCQLHRRG